jgi:hypothetical protein
MIALCTGTEFQLQAAGQLVCVSDATTEYTGKIVALNRSRCTLMDRQGRLVNLEVPKLTGMSQIGTRFHADSVSSFRTSLRTEFGKAYEVTGTTHYLVCAPAGRAKIYAGLFEQIYRDVDHFYRVRGFNVARPDVPLVAVVFASRKKFLEYCIRDNVPPSQGLQGYYSLVTNRVALFDESGLFSTISHNPPARPASIAALSGISGQTTSTIVHEAIHQVGYNIGIHPRLGDTPLWMVEGMATVLEPASMRTRKGNNAALNRINRQRYDWFRNQHLPNRSAGSLARLVASDTMFQQQTLSAYSESWALTFFLLENPARRKQLTAYLQAVASRDSTASYAAKERLTDFETAFGDIARLEIEFLRYMSRL